MVFQPDTAGIPFEACIMHGCVLVASVKGEFSVLGLALQQRCYILTGVAGLVTLI